MISDTRSPCDEAVVQSAPDCGSPASGKWVLAATILGSGITFIDGTVVNVALPVLQSELGASVSAAQWIIEGYALILSALILVGGALGDHYGRKRIFLIGSLIFAAASAWCGLSPGINNLIVARCVQGFGAALLVPGSLALISANFDKARRGRAIGTWAGFTSIAAGIGPVLGGWLIQAFSWRWIFFINIPLAVVLLLITFKYVPESRDQDSTTNVDWVGALLATVGLGGIVFGLIESNIAGLAAPRVIAFLVIGVLGLVAFLFVEDKKKQPMMPLELFRIRTFTGANLLTLFLYAGLGGLLFFLPFNLIQVQGYSPAAAGAALLPFVITMFALGRWAGGLVERYGSKIPLVVGPLIAGAGFALFAVPGSVDHGYWIDFFPAVMVMSFGMAVSVSPLTTTVMGAVEVRHAGLASGINNAVSRTAGLIAVAAFGVVMLFVFDNSFAEKLQAIQLPDDVRQNLLGQSGKFLNIEIPQGITGDAADAVRAAVRDSFVAGFRVVSLVSAGLAVLSAIASWILIDGKKQKGRGDE